MWYVKQYSENKPDEILASYDNFDDALKHKVGLIKEGKYDEVELCIEDFLR